MLICPTCKKEIDHLHNQSTQWHGYDMTLDKEGYANYEEYDIWEHGENYFVCPECDAILFNDETDAKKFLKGK